MPTNLTAVHPVLHTVFLTAVMLFFSCAAHGDHSIWQTLFSEKLVEAAQGNSAAQYDVGAMYQNGRGVQPDRRKAIEWYKKAAAQNYQSASARLKLMKSNQERFNKERQSAETGDAESQYNLGNMYTKGVGVNIDHEQAGFWFEKAAEQGHVKSEYKLGQIYYETADTEKLRKTAFRWLDSAAVKGYPPAQYYLGKMYASGFGVTRDYTTALQWFRRALDGGFRQARGEIIEVSEKLDDSRRTGEKTTHSRKRNSHKDYSDENQATAPAHSLKISGSTNEIMQQLMMNTWNRNEEPVAWLPSAVNDCKVANERIICNTGDLTQKSNTHRIKYKTRSIISDFSADGSFRVAYRNLVIDAHQADSAQGRKMHAGYDAEETDKGFVVKTDWGRENTLHCYLKNSTRIACLKNRIQNLELVSRPTIAGDN